MNFDRGTNFLLDSISTRTLLSRDIEIPIFSVIVITFVKLIIIKKSLNLVIKKYLRRKNGKRDAILTIQNRLHLKSPTASPKILNGMKKDIDKRMGELKTDLDIIYKSKHLESWIAINRGKLGELKQIFSDMTFSYKPVYLYPVKRYKKKFGKRKLSVYWMDLSEKPKQGNDKIFESSYALRKIRSRLTNDSIKTLTKAIESGIIPTSRDNAKPEEAFESAFHDEEKLSSLKASVDSPGKKIILKLKPEIEKARKQETELWTFTNLEIDKLNKILAKKFGTAISHVEFHPRALDIDF